MPSAVVRLIRGGRPLEGIHDADTRREWARAGRCGYPPRQRARATRPAEEDEEPGARGYWDASIASTANAYVTAGLAIYALVQNPSLMTSEDFYLILYMWLGGLCAGVSSRPSSDGMVRGADAASRRRGWRKCDGASLSAQPGWTSARPPASARPMLFEIDSTRPSAPSVNCALSCQYVRILVPYSASTLVGDE